MKCETTLSIVFSFRNEADVLNELIDRVEMVLSRIGISYELIFVNDNSTDESLAILVARRYKNSAIKIINMSRRFGNTPCVLAGLEYSLGDAVIYMDSDLQDPPELIPALIKSWHDGYDVVHTTRTTRHGESGLKLWLTDKAYRLIDWSSDLNVPKNTGDFKLLSRRAVESILKIKEIDPFMRGLSLWIGFPQSFVSYEREPRKAGRTHYSLLRSVNPYTEFIRGLTAFSSVPLYFALIIGFAVSCGAFVYLLLIVVQRIFLDVHLPGWPALMVTMLFLGGSILFTTGVLGIYVGKIYNEVKGRPRFVIQQLIGFSDVD